MLLLPGSGFTQDFPLASAKASAVAAAAVPSARAAAPEPPRPSPAAEWTVMVFMNGKNDLEAAALRDLNEMEMVGSGGGVNIVVEAGLLSGRDAQDAGWTGVRRYLVRRDSDPEKINSPVLADLGAADMGDWRSLEAFGRWAKAAYPARRYLLIVWNHGSGWLKGAEKGISYDDATNNHIDTPQLSRALRGIGRVDALGFDACLMQMAEVAYELRGTAEVMIGSEEIEAGSGWDYAALLGALAARPGMAPEELAGLTVNTFADYYAARNAGSTLSWLRLSEMDRLAELARNFAAAAAASGDGRALRTALQDSISYQLPQNSDLYDLARLAAENTHDPALRRAALELNAFITGRVVGLNRTTTAASSGEDMVKDYSASHGLAIYAPGVSISAGYEELAWAGATGWPAFIRWYLPFMK